MLREPPPVVYNFADTPNGFPTLPSTVLCNRAPCQKDKGSGVKPLELKPQPTGIKRSITDGALIICGRQSGGRYYLASPVVVTAP